MDLARIVAGITDDLRRAGAIGGEETAHAVELVVAGIEPTMRLHLLEGLYEAARELEASAPGVAVAVRLEGRDPVVTLTSVPSNTGEAGADPAVEPPWGYAEDKLVRLTVRLPEGLKTRVEQGAAGVGVSINSWIVAALARATDEPGGLRSQPGRRVPKRITGFVQG
jgi:hypothetical protein